jgi:cell division septation protein DedD
MPPRDPFDRDNLDEDREILDIIPERFDSDPDSRHARRAAHTRLILTISLAVLAACALGVAAKHILFGESPRDHQLSVPVIHAEDKPIKVKPQDRGGMDVPNQDKLIYDRMAAKKDEPEPERLLPPPEQAQTPPPPATTAPAPIANSGPVPALSAPLPPAVTAPAPVPALTKAQPAPAPQATKPAPTVAAPVAVPPVAKGTAGGGWVVQLGAVHSDAEAKAEWNRLKGIHPELAGLSPEIERVDIPGKGLFWRVRGGPLEEAQARVLCASLSKQGQGCLVAKK